MKKLFMLTSLLVIAGCSSGFDPLQKMVGSYRNYIDIDGKIEDGIYYDPIGRFHMNVPTLVEPGAVISGQMNEMGGAVQFADDLGRLIRVDVISATTPNSLAMITNKDWQAVLGLNRESMLDLYQTVSPQASLICQEYIQVDERNVDYYVCKLPEGSTLADVETDKRYDALRASMAFREGTSVYVLTTQHVIGLWRDNEDETELAERMKEELMEILPTMSFSETP
ncbi:MAG: hypothetical protein JXR40_03795 [Pontiellaceae bacterium]|nr:hypothetical protein [Pontiellaceae bacterium]